MRKARRSLALACALACVTGCHHPLSSSPTTGLTGVVVRGPITPVCRVDQPCDGPFSAGFSVEQEGRRVSQFRSDVDGRFTVWLERGSYRVVPDSDAPLMSPRSQAREVTVGPAGLTEVRLQFDTGIR